MDCLEINNLLNELCTKTETMITEKSYDSVCAFISGYNEALGGSMLHGFREWLIVKANGGDNMAWQALALYVIFPGEKKSIQNIRKNRVQELTAIEKLPQLFKDFFTESNSDGGMEKIKNNYEKWKKKNRIL